MFNVKSQDDYNALRWDDRLRYNAANPDSQYAQNERKRTEQALYTKPTEQAQNWWAQQQFVKSGGSVEDAILGNFDKSAYKWNAGTPVRSALNGYGIGDDRIGYSDGKVTLDGKEFLTPDAVADGKSYASDEAIKNALRSYNESNDTVPVRNYVNTKNPAVNVGWDAELGQVLVGSQRLTPDYITPDGRAQVSKARVDAALEKEAADTGIYTRRDILEQNNSRWNDRIDRLYDLVENPDPFTYSAEEDPLYQDFKREWMKQSQAQYDDTIAKMNSQSGGAPSLGAMAAAWNMLQDSNGQLDAYKQQFREQAYQEYVDSYNRDIARLETALGMRDKEFEREYGVNDDMLNDMYYRAEWESDMKTQALNQATTEEALNQSKQLFPLELEDMRARLAHDEALRPYELLNMALAVQTGELQLTDMELDVLAKQMTLSGMTPSFSSGRSSGGGSGSGENASGGDGGDPVKKSTYSSVADRNKQADEEARKYLTNDEVFAIAKSTIDNGTNFDTDLETAIKYVLGTDFADEGTLAKVLNAIKYYYSVPQEKFEAIVSKYE